MRGLLRLLTCLLVLFGLVSCFSEDVWTNKFVTELEGDESFNPNQRVIPGLFWSLSLPTPFVQNPSLFHYNLAAVEQLGLSQQPPVEYLSGQSYPPFSRPYAQNYAGHQFGHYSPQLGDGRAHSLGEITSKTTNTSWEIQLKGSGKTPYSRRGDGRAVLRSSVREYVLSIAMEALGIPTTHVLSLVTTPQTTKRDKFYNGNIKDEPMAIVTRFSRTFIRFGTFERFYYQNRHDLLQILTNFTITHFFPELQTTEHPEILFFLTVANQTAKLVSQWQSIGFTHGVLNTDNMNIMSVTIDYGPFGFLDAFDPDYTPNGSDDEQRYSFKNQPDVALYNINKLCKALSPTFKNLQSFPKTDPGLFEVKKPFFKNQRLFSDRQLFQDPDGICELGSLNFLETFKDSYYRKMLDKIGIFSSLDTQKQALIDDMLLAIRGLDYTLFFRKLNSIPLKEASDIDSCSVSTEVIQEGEAYLELMKLAKGRSALLENWFLRYLGFILNEQESDAERREKTDKLNPTLIFRNWIAEDFIQMAGQGELFNQRLDLFRFPFNHTNNKDHPYSKLPPEWANEIKLTCSS